MHSHVIDQSSADVLGRLRSDDGWYQRGEEMALQLFHQMAERVPAYTDFLQRNRVSVSDVQTVKDLASVPLTDKDNYLRAYPREQLCWDGDFSSQPWLISSTSGSTGKPFYFPRTPVQDKQFQLTAELCLNEYFDIGSRSTLFVNCFALGIWIGGMFMAQCIQHLMDTGKYQLSMVTPGADHIEAIKAVQNLGRHFDQIIIGGYAPLVKDLVDTGIDQGLDWNQHDMKYFFAAEGFTEGYRDYIAKKGGVKNVYKGLINHYGTADMGTMSHETSLTIWLRRKALQQPELYAELFQEAHRLPTFTQYIPELYRFEVVEDRLVCSGPSGFPLMRYDLKDRGGVLHFGEVFSLCEQYGIDLQAEAERDGIADSMWKLPFVYLFERTDFTVNIYSVNVYPESIRKALDHQELENCITGKFCMLVDYDDNQDQVMEINVELKPGVEENLDLEQKTMQSIVHWLNQENSEWRDFYDREEIRSKILPRLRFWPHRHESYFRPGGKQKWVK